MHVISASVHTNDELPHRFRTTVTCCDLGVLCVGEPGQLEASLRQLDQALDAGRYQLQQREATANNSSPDIDSTYMGYVSVSVF